MLTAINIVLYIYGKKYYLLLILVPLMISSPQDVFANPDSRAQLVCDGLKYNNDQCTVNSSNLTIDAIINTNSEEARSICFGIADTMPKYGVYFYGKWQLQIFSPSSGERPIAVCTLK